MTVPKPETNYQSTVRLLRESQERLRAEQLKDPQQAAMLRAHQPTKGELAAIEAAEQAVSAAEAVVDAAGLTVARARQGIPPSYDTDRPFSFFERKPEGHRAARAALPDLELDLAEARNALQSAIRRRNQTIRAVDAARAERRADAKRKHALPRTRAASRGGEWGSFEAMDRWARVPRRKDAA